MLEGIGGVFVTLVLDACRKGNEVRVETRNDFKRVPEKPDANQKLAHAYPGAFSRLDRPEHSK
jgi:hypothetical protein